MENITANTLSKILNTVLRRDCRFVYNVRFGKVKADGRVPCPPTSGRDPGPNIFDSSSSVLVGGGCGVIAVNTFWLLVGVITSVGPFAISDLVAASAVMLCGVSAPLGGFGVRFPSILSASSSRTAVWAGHRFLIDCFQFQRIKTNI